jgi:hypothetical protein
MNEEAFRVSIENFTISISVLFWIYLALKNIRWVKPVSGFSDPMQLK